MAGPTTDVPEARPADPADATRAVPEEVHPRPAPPRRAHFPGFEGLRALAASAVVVYHAVTLAGSAATGRLYTPVSVLDMGVSVFFVISGFLIYRPFVAAGAEGREPAGPLRFWWRRVLRIVPAYWLALSVLWGLGWVDLGPQPWRFYLFLQIYDAYTTLSGIVPAWSLNTEMSFYLFVPLWAFLVRKVATVRRGAGRGRPSVALEVGGTVALVVAGYLSRAVMSDVDRVWAVGGEGQVVTMREVSFSWLPNTIDLFALGMLVAVLSVAAARDDRLRARLDRLAQPAGLWWAVAAGAWLVFAYGLGEPSLNGGYRGGYWQARQACFGVVAVALLVPAVFGDQDRGLIRRVLRMRPVAWLGAVSYGLYLWHQDLLERIPGWLDRPPSEVPVALLLAGAFALGLLAAAVSWYGLEKPLARVRRQVAATSPS